MLILVRAGEQVSEVDRNFGVHRYGILTKPPGTEAPRCHAQAVASLAADPTFLTR
ncbi:hypothetical protein [Sorangium sp. So ce1153]|uniref:hypothetical protein n=1 Tax=Sorangium sp. So ce1153 TaxID=3133333 RepID=UPI003F5EE3A2